MKKTQPHIVTTEHYAAEVRKDSFVVGSHYPNDLDSRHVIYLHPNMESSRFGYFEMLIEDIPIFRSLLDAVEKEHKGIEQQEMKPIEKEKFDALSSLYKTISLVENLQRWIPDGPYASAYARVLTAVADGIAMDIG